MMKRVFLCLLCVCLCFALLACKSEEVKNVEELIEDIGKVSLDSGDAIAEAEEAYDELSKDDKKKVENYDDLEDARADYNELAVEYVEDLIDDLGNISVDSGAAIDEARSAYDALDKEAQKEVGNLDVLTDAEDQYALIESVMITDFAPMDTSNVSSMTATFEEWYEESYAPAILSVLLHLQATSSDIVEVEMLTFTDMYVARDMDERRLDSIVPCSDGRVMWIQYWPDQDKCQIGFKETSLSMQEYMDVLLEAGIIDEYTGVARSDYAYVVEYLAG